eukprot:6096159-Alexandrium_andersonii.AAC.1
MSASLVGSEMCIRDRRATAARCLQNVSRARGFDLGSRPAVSRACAMEPNCRQARSDHLKSDDSGHPAGPF